MQVAEYFQCHNCNKTLLKEYEIQNLEFSTWPRSESTIIVFSEEKEETIHSLTEALLANETLPFVISFFGDHMTFII